MSKTHHQSWENFKTSKKATKNKKSKPLETSTFYALRLEGRLKGRLEGRIEGRSEGRLEGRLDGRLEGR